MTSKKNWQLLLDKISTRLNAWKEKTLSMGGRITLIKSVLGSLPIYYMSLFRAPINMINSIEQIQRNFCWGMSNDKRRFCWISWDRMLVSKTNEGARIGSISAANKALLAKWIWKFKNEKERLWAHCIIALHHNRRNNHDPPVKRSSTGPWKSITKNHDDLISYHH